MGLLGAIGKWLGVKEDKEKLWADDSARNVRNDNKFGIFLGESTGEFSKRGHNNGMWPDQEVWLEQQAACQNIIIFGGIGAGKTTAVIQPVLQQLLCYQDVGGFVFDIKGDFKNALDLYAASVGRKVYHIGIGSDCYGFNLIGGLRPEQVADFMTSAFYLTGGGSTDTFWLDSATNLVKNVLGYLQILGPKYYSMEHLYKYIFDSNTQRIYDSKIDDDFMEQMKDDTSDYSIVWKNYASYVRDAWPKIPDKTRETVKAQLLNMISCFQQPEIMNAFSSSANQECFDLTEILSGGIAVLDLPIALYGSGAKMIYTIIKLRFFNLLQMRQYKKELPQNLCFFLCDEYQEIISAAKNASLSDLNFWDKARSAKVLGIVSTQSVNAFYSSIGNRELADTVMANFRNKIYFRTEDPMTIQQIQGIGGKVTITRTSTNYSRSEQDYKFFQGNTTYGTNTQEQELDLIDPSLVRQLNMRYAICFLNDNSGAVDDVVFMPVYYDNEGDGEGQRGYFINNILPRISGGRYENLYNMGA